jgi:hypothetical protein
MISTSRHPACLMALAVRQISASATLTALMCENVVGPFCRALEQFADEPAESASAPFSAALGRTPRLSGVGFVFTLFSQAFEDRHFRKFWDFLRAPLTLRPLLILDCGRRVLISSSRSTVKTALRRRGRSVPRWLVRQGRKIAKASTASRIPINGLMTAKPKGNAPAALRVRSPCSLCVAACTELNQLQRQAPSPATRTVAQSGFVFMLCISSIRRSTFQKTRTLLRCPNCPR